MFPTPDKIKSKEMAANFLHSTREWIKFNVFRPMLLGVGKAIGPFSTVGNPPVFSNDKFPFTQLLEANWPAIRTELEQVMQYSDSLPTIQEKCFPFIIGGKYMLFLLYILYAW